MTWATRHTADEPGSTLLDSDHRILVSLVNQLHEAMDSRQGYEVVASIVTVLAEYLEHHFRREEDALTRGGFPLTAELARDHRAFEAAVQDLRTRWQAGERDALCESVMLDLKKWLTNHIAVADKSYRPWVQRAGRVDDGMGRASRR